MSDDWDTVTVLRKRPANAAAGRTDQAISAARRAGAEVSTEKKYGGGGNRQHGAAKDTAVLDRETEELKHATVSMDVGKAIAQARLAKQPTWTQKDLATKINEKPTVISEYESGKALPNQQILGKLERVLGVKLRGKDIGSPFGPAAAAASAAGGKEKAKK